MKKTNPVDFVSYDENPLLKNQNDSSPPSSNAPVQTSLEPACICENQLPDT